MTASITDFIIVTDEGEHTVAATRAGGRAPRRARRPARRDRVGAQARRPVPRRRVRARRGPRRRSSSTGRVDLRVVADALRAPFVVDDRSTSRCSATSAADRAPNAKDMRVAPDLALHDLDGNVHQLVRARRKKKVLTRGRRGEDAATTCPGGRRSQDELRAQDVVVVSLALDEADAAREWVEAARPDTIPSFVDPDHVIAERLGDLQRADRASGSTRTIASCARR